ncbi:50S ribosomal protein L11 methyltransferase [Mobilitalea sibirica]|uniref:Ribosomal protein L11 methyltransferase n=1 Tax=Mobilitalea sibirica TaxID=1462919 RepID=A0A8J7H381_9FIRM|nr:50S ribosomal protein L11 methyltransferase [Mobilitalea sibirica]MBH1941432.1 50S ribosomal protein L11 methyltransferase [Mobilitalea sibirica]
MKWTKFTLDTTTEAVDLISNMLSELGIEGIEIADKIQITEEERKRLFIDFLPELGEDDGTATVSFYIEASDDSNKILREVEVGLKELSEYVNIGSGNIRISDTEDKDWINNWKQFFKPFRIDDTIVIKPTWEELTEHNPTDMVIEIDPGTSFGTGAHETTKLCILSLKKYMKPGYMVLDAGSGSGILSIIASKFGANYVIGMDIDPLATDAAIENARVNGLKPSELDLLKASEYHFGSDNSDITDKISGGLVFVTGNIIENDMLRTQLGQNKYDIVVANILADVIIPLSKVIGENIKPGGIFISSGIINTKEKDVREALLWNSFEILEVNKMGDWVCFVAKK